MKLLVNKLFLNIFAFRSTIKAVLNLEFLGILKSVGNLDYHRSS